jgi:hypothetical protein
MRTGKEDDRDRSQSAFPLNSTSNLDLLMLARHMLLETDVDQSRSADSGYRHSGSELEKSISLNHRSEGADHVAALLLEPPSPNEAAGGSHRDSGQGPEAGWTGHQEHLVQIGLSSPDAAVRIIAALRELPASWTVQSAPAVAPDFSGLRGVWVPSGVDASNPTAWSRQSGTHAGNTARSEPLTSTDANSDSHSQRYPDGQSESHSGWSSQNDSFSHASGHYDDGAGANGAGGSLPLSGSSKITADVPHAAAPPLTASSTSSQATVSADPPVPEGSHFQSAVTPSAPFIAPATDGALPSALNAGDPSLPVPPSEPAAGTDHPSDGALAGDPSPPATPSEPATATDHPGATTGTTAPAEAHQSAEAAPADPAEALTGSKFEANSAPETLSFSANSQSYSATIHEYGAAGSGVSAAIGALVLHELTNIDLNNGAWHDHPDYDYAAAAAGDFNVELGAQHTDHPSISNHPNYDFGMHLSSDPHHVDTHSISHDS